MLHNANVAVLSADGRLAATADNEGHLRLWDAADGRLLAVFDYPWKWRFQPISVLAFSPDGKWLAVGGRDDLVIVWDVARRAVARTFSGHFPDVWTLRFSPDGRWLAVASANTAVHLWNLETGQQATPLFHPSTHFPSVAFSPVADVLATLTENLENRIRLWSFKDGQLLATFDVPEDETSWNVSFSPDGELLAAACGKTLRFYPWRSLLQARQWPPAWRGHEQRAWSLAFSPDGRRLVSAGRDGSVRLWSAQQRRSHKLPLTPTSDAAAFTPKGDELILAVKGYLQVWNRRQRTLRQLAVCPDQVFYIAVAPDGATITTGHHNGTVQFWDYPSGQRRESLKAHDGAVDHVVYSPDGTVLATTCRHDNTIKLWDTASGAELAALHFEIGFHGGAFSPDGQLLAIPAGNDIALFSGDGGRLIRRLHGHQLSVHAVAFSPDGRLLASAGGDRKVRIWDVATGAELHEVHAHRDGASTIAFSPDGRTLASADQGGTVAFSHVATGRFLYDVQVGEWIRNLQFSSDGGLLAVLTRFYGVTLLEGPPASPPNETRPKPIPAPSSSSTAAEDLEHERPQNMAPPQDAPTTPPSPATEDNAPPQNPRFDVAALSYVKAAERRLDDISDWNWSTNHRAIEQGRTQAAILKETLDRLKDVEDSLARGELTRPQLEHTYDHLKNCELALRGQWTNCRIGHHLPQAQKLDQPTLEAAIRQQITQIREFIAQELNP